MMNINKLVTLVSVAHHPLSGKEIYSTNDTRALQLAMGLDAKIHKVVHAGDRGCPALSGYLGMGIDKIHCIDTSYKGTKNKGKAKDACSLLAGFIKKENPTIVVSGMQAQSGLGSGLLPYMLADILGINLISNVLHAEVGEKEVNLVQFLPKGKRRELSVRPPFILSVHPAAPLNIKYAWGRSQAGRIAKADASLLAVPALSDDWDNAPLEKGRKRLSISTGKSGFERMQRAIAISGGGGEVVKYGSAGEKAKVVYDFLADKKLV